MSHAEARRELTWFVVESHDRWYRAVCRFAPAMVSRGESLRIVRIVPTSISALSFRVKSVRGQVVIVWALGVSGRDEREGFNWGEAFDQISALRVESPLTLQVAAFWSKPPAEVVFAACEAGIAVFLESIESFPRLEKPLQRRFDPLG